MGQNRGARGATTTEYVGVVAFVAVLVAGLMALVPDVRAAATGVMDRSFCTIGQAVGAGGGCDAATSAHAPGSDTPDSRSPSSDTPGSDNPGTDPPGGPTDAPAPAPTPPTGRERAEAGDYVALGDSFSSGEGAGDYLDDTDTDDNTCHRSGNAYGQVVHSGGNFTGNLVFGACSGGVVDDYFGESGQAGEPPQADLIGPDTSLVTISMGGNDFGFADVLTTCVTSLRSCARDEHDREVRDRIDQEAQRLVAMYLDMRARAGADARLLVLGYPRMFPQDPNRPVSLSVSISAKERRWLNQMADHANAAIKEAVAAANAQGADIEYVDVTHALAGHELGTKDPWLNDLSLHGFPPSVNPESFHPNAAGQAAFAEAVNQAIDRRR